MKCKHDQFSTLYESPIQRSYRIVIAAECVSIGLEEERCVRCGAYFSLGPSADSDPAEMRLALEIASEHPMVRT